MPMKVVYTTINGVVVHENRAGVQRNYRPDTLGNTVALTDATTATDTMTYWPYGEIRTRTGTNATRFLFVGTLGYSKDGGSGILHYVRARYYQASKGRWATVDPLWPVVWQYVYADTRPNLLTDPSGMLAVAFCQEDDCSKLKGLRGGCIALLCSLKTSRDLYNLIKGLFKNIENFKDILDILKKLQSDDPMTKQQKCCKKAGAFRGKLEDVRSIEDLIGFLCGSIGNNLPAGICAKTSTTEAECMSCCQRLAGRGLTDKWEGKCRDFCTAKDWT